MLKDNRCEHCKYHYYEQEDRPSVDGILIKIQKINCKLGKHITIFDMSLRGDCFAPLK